VVHVTEDHPLPRIGTNKRKLTEEQVREIKRALAEGRSSRDIARQFGVTGSTVRDIAAGDRWGWVKP
jgi:DNA-binding NarL/FixJ family response regulator